MAHGAQMIPGIFWSLGVFEFGARSFDWTGLKKFDVKDMADGMNPGLVLSSKDGASCLVGEYKERMLMTPHSPVLMGFFCDCMFEYLLKYNSCAFRSCPVSRSFMFSGVVLYSGASACSCVCVCVCCVEHMDDRDLYNGSSSDGATRLTHQDGVKLPVQKWPSQVAETDVYVLRDGKHLPHEESVMPPPRGGSRQSETCKEPFYCH